MIRKEQAGGKCSRLVYQLNALFSLLHFPSMSLVFEHMDAQRDWQTSYFRPARLPSGGGTVQTMDVSNEIFALYYRPLL